MLEKRKIGPCSKGPYSYAIQVGDVVHIEGITAIDLKTKSLVDGDIKSQLIHSLENIETILETVELDLRQVVKLDVILTDKSQLTTLNQVMSLYFSHPYPVRSVWIAELADGALCQLGVIAYDTKESDYQKMIMEDDCGGEGC